MTTLASSPDLAAEIGPYLASLLHSREESITAAVHPLPARWATGHVLLAIEAEMPLLASHVIGYLTLKLKDVTLGETTVYLEHLFATSGFAPNQTH